jgi:hypothetical protein
VGGWRQVPEADRQEEAAPGRTDRRMAAPTLLARALAAVSGSREPQRRRTTTSGTRTYHTSWIAREQHQQQQQTAPVATAGTQQQQPPPPAARKKPPPPSRAVLAVGRVAHQRWVTVAGVVVLGVGGIMAADWAAESLVNWWQGKRDGEDDF